ncbi:MAG: response regulator transcription factor [Sedimentibacter sp.]
MEIPRVLIADDDYEIVQLVTESLEDEGYEVLKAYNGQEVVRIIENQKVSLIILDIMMPEMDGLEVCRKVRNDISVPIILLSAKDRELDKIIGLEVGADDYITKPFSTNELIARVNAHIRREKRNSESKLNVSGVFEFGNLKIDKDKYEVYKHGCLIDLSTREFQILLYLAANNNKVLSREQIYGAIWGNSEFGDINTVTVHIKNIRSKLDQDNKYIKTVWGIGYKFTGDHHETKHKI